MTMTSRRLCEWRTLRLCCVCLLMLATLSVGCKRKAVVRKTRAIKAISTREESNPFEVAIEFLNSLEEYQPGQAHAQIINHLREWSRQQKAAVDWVADPMFARLPSDLAANFSSDRLSTKEFETYDALVLQEATWARDVAKTVAKMPIYEPHIQAGLKAVADSLSADGKLSSDEARDNANDLSLAYRMFDWTVRNVQLDPEIQDRDILGDEQARERRDNDTLRHLYQPWELMLFSHGDWLERSRLFIMLSRQVGINVVMLVADREGQPEQPWVPAALIGDQLYLFDPQLGIPLPGQGGAVFGSLADYVGDPSLLDALNVDATRYRIVKSDLQNISPAIDATPAQLSQRMKQIEVRLRGERKIALTTEPSSLNRKLRTCKGINGNPRIWALPYYGYMYTNERNKLIQLSRESPGPATELPKHVLDLLADNSIEQRPFSSRTELMQGRLLQLRGKYRADDTLGAAGHYMNSRMSKREMRQFSTPLAKVPPQSPLRNGLPEDPVQAEQLHRQRMLLGRDMAIWSKHMATHWLGEATFDQHKFKVAKDYFEVSAADAEEEGGQPSRWQQNAKYNLARAYEALGTANSDTAQLEKAISLYEADKTTPQRTGNLIRAQQLRARKKP